MSLSDEQWLFLQDVARLIEYVKSHEWKLTGGELMRTIEQQKIYFDSGKSKTLNSSHIKKLAIDLAFFSPTGEYMFEKKDIQWAGNYWEELDRQNKWGGNYKSFPDCPHFERVI